jgi:ABC-2 type transport system permease protein
VNGAGIGSPGAFLILQPMVFLSGAWNPPEAMRPWLRGLSVISPLRYFIEFAFGVILKGTPRSQLRAP